MFTRDERRALLFLAVVTAAGVAVRLHRGAEAPPGEGLLAPHLTAGDLARQQELVREAEARARPLAPGERVDVDRAGALEIERLPRIGPELARRIVASRDSQGGFGSLEALGEVPGIGPAVLAAIRGHVTFSAEPRSLPPVLPGPTRAGNRRDACARLVTPISLNSAGPEELACLPGLGDGLAGRIVADRNARGPFREVAELERVAGIGKRRIQALRGLLVVP